MSNYVFVARSIDGFIAKPDGNIDWLNDFEKIENEDFGYAKFISQIDAIIMGRRTFEKVVNFEIWPYERPVYVLSRTLPPENVLPNYEITNVQPLDLISKLKAKGLSNFYIDGGNTISGFLDLNLIDNIIITELPVILGSGIPLFLETKRKLKLKLDKSIEYKNGFVQNYYSVKF